MAPPVSQIARELAPFLEGASVRPAWKRVIDKLRGDPEGLWDVPLGAHGPTRQIVYEPKRYQRVLDLLAPRYWMTRLGMESPEQVQAHDEALGPWFHELGHLKQWEPDSRELIPLRPSANPESITAAKWKFAAKGTPWLGTLLHDFDPTEIDADAFGMASAFWKNSRDAGQYPLFRDWDLYQLALQQAIRGRTQMIDEVPFADQLWLRPAAGAAADVAQPRQGRLW